MPKIKTDKKARYLKNDFLWSFKKIKDIVITGNLTTKKFVVLLCLSIGMVTLGCTGNEEPKCLPQEAILPQIRKRIKKAKNKNASMPKTVTVYFDGSGSMRGFVPTNENRTGFVYCNFLRFLGENRFFTESETNFKAFGACIRDLSITKELYPMVGLVNSGCRHKWYQQKDLKCPKNKKTFNSISRLDLVLKEIQQSPKSNLSIVVTDLFLSHERAVANVIPTVDLLRQIMNNNKNSSKAVGIIGVKSKFKGIIDDLPGREAYLLDGYLPFYILIFGESQPVKQIIQSIKNEENNLLLGSNNEKIKTAFFSSLPNIEPITLKKLQNANLINIKGFERTAYLTNCKGDSKLGPHQQFNCYCNKDHNHISVHMDDSIINYGVSIKKISSFYVTWWKYSPNKPGSCQDKWQRCGTLIKNPPINVSLEIKGINNWTVHLKGPSKKLNSNSNLYYGEIVLKAKEIDTQDNNWLLQWNYNLGLNPKKFHTFHPTPHLKSLYKVMKISMNSNFKNKEITCLGIIVDMK